MVLFIVIIVMNLFGCIRSSLCHVGSPDVVSGLSCPLACGILVPQPGVEPQVPCIGRQVLNPWTTREVPVFLFFDKDIKAGATQMITSRQ